MLRRSETIAWIAAIGVVAVLGGFLLRSGGPGPVPFQPGVASVARAATPTPDPATSCLIYGCASPVPTGPPTRVRIPSIKVDSPLLSLTLNRQHELNAPPVYDKAGWYAAGVVPGDSGPAVIAGHVDSYKGPGVFFKLGTLKAGDTIEVQRGGQWLTFQVTRVESYPKDRFPTDRVYGATPDAELRVITCGGDFDTVHRRYYDNVVVYAGLV